MINRIKAAYILVLMALMLTLPGCSGRGPGRNDGRLSLILSGSVVDQDTLEPVEGIGLTVSAFQGDGSQKAAPLWNARLKTGERGVWTFEKEVDWDAVKYTVTTGGEDSSGNGFEDTVYDIFLDWESNSFDPVSASYRVNGITIYVTAAR